MADAIFIYPPLSVSERYGNKDVGDAGGNLPPLGIASLAAFLLDRGFEINVIDALSEGKTVGEIAKQIGKEKPKVVGFSCLTSAFHRATITAKKLREKFPEILIVIGGHHASIMPKEVMKENKCFDLLTYGEGELTTLEMMEKYKESGYNRKKFLKDYKTLSKIKGLVYREGGKVVVNAPMPPIKNLDELPVPARHLLPMEKYIPLPNQYKRKPVVHMVAIRGCPFNCSFCSNNSVFGRAIRAKSPKKVVEEIEHVKKEYGAKEISFWDDTMTVNKKWMAEFCDLLIKKNVDVTWTCYARVDTVTPELLKKMKKAGCWNIFYGIEAGSQKLLDNINKGITLDQIRNAVKWTKEAGIEVRGSFMIALPGETPELARETIKFAKELNPDYAQFSITTPYPGTALYDCAEKYGKLTKNFSEYHGWDAVFVPHGYRNKEEVMAMEKEAFRSFYMRFGYIWGRIRKINSLEDILRYLKGARFLLGFSK